MSKDKKKQSSKRETDGKQPWEQSIYDTEYDAVGSRSQKRKTKKGNTLFLKLLLTMLILIVAIIIGWILFLRFDSGQNNVTAPTNSTSSSTIESTVNSTSEVPVESTEPSESEPVVEEPPAEEEPPAVEEPQTTPEESYNTDDDTTDADTGAEYAEVQRGEGHNTFATRNGISLERMYELNGLNSSSVIHPGESLRIR